MQRKKIAETGIEAATVAALGYAEGIAQGSNVLTDETEVLSDDDLLHHLVRLEREAYTFQGSSLIDEQAAANDFYEARPFGDEQEGRSQVVTPVVQEVVDYMTVSVLRSFLTAPKVVEFRANSEDQEVFAGHATECLNRSFLREQDGYRTLHDWLKTGLIEKISAAKTICVSENVTRVRNIDLTTDEFALLSAEIEASDTPDAIELVSAEPLADDSVRVRLRETRSEKRFIDVPIPNYEFLFAPRSLSEDESPYLCHRTWKTVGDLIEMGFNPDIVEDVKSGVASEYYTDSRLQSTWEDEDPLGLFDETTDDVPGMRRVMLMEEYVRIDRDGDGVPELLRVYRVGDTILEVEEVSEAPFVVFSPFPRAHRLVGGSLAEKVMDIQRTRSVIMRHTLDGFYMTINPRWWLPVESTTEDTIDDLLTVAPGVIVRGRGAAPQAMTQAFDVGRGLSLSQYVQGEQESRTGITRLNQGLDSDTLNKTASGQAQLQAQGQQMEEYIARNFGNALERLMMKKLRLFIEYGDPKRVRMGRTYADVNPQNWSGDMVAEVSVGLGTASKDARLSARALVANLQREVAQTDLALVGPKQLYNSGAGIIRDTGIGEVSDYWLDPDSQEAAELKAAFAAEQAVVQGAEDEAAQAKVAMEMQREQAKAAFHAQLARDKAVVDAELAREAALHSTELAEIRAKSDAFITRQKAELDAQLSRDKAAAEIELARMKMDAEAGLARERMAVEAAFARKAQEEAELGRASGSGLPKEEFNTLPRYHPGGDLSV